MSALRVRRLGYALGAEVTGIDLREHLPDDTIAEIRKAWLDHIVLCFSGQSLDEEGMIAFCRRFGALNDSRRTPLHGHPKFREVMVLSNKPVETNGKPAGGYHRNLND